MAAVPSISDDGRYVAFGSGASHLVPGDNNNWGDVFVRDRVSGVTELVSITSAGVQGYGGASWDPSISSDGRYVAFTSEARTLVAVLNFQADVFVHDRVSGVTEQVSVSSTGVLANNESYATSISGDGRYIAFHSFASNLVPGDTNGVDDVFVRDRVSGVTERVSVSSSDNEANSDSYMGSISGDGRYVTFSSDASNVVTGDDNEAIDVFVRDRTLGVTERVSVSSSGTEANNYSYVSSISDDGRYVAFHSAGSNLVADDTNGDADVFVHDRVLGTTHRVSVSSLGTEGNVWSVGPSITSDGRYVAFLSDSTNLVAGDTNETWDVFLAEFGVFADIADSVFEADIEWLADAGVTKGCNPPVNTMYCPDDYVTRGQMAAFLVRALDYTDSGAGDPFADDDDSIFETDIDRLATAGVTRGCNPPVNDEFCPTSNVTRGQMAAFLHRALG